MIVEGKVIAGNDVDPGILLNLPMSKSESLGFGQQVDLRKLAAPVWVRVLAQENNKWEQQR